MTREVRSNLKVKNDVLAGMIVFISRPRNFGHAAYIWANMVL
jgi:hypothetical protein